MRLAAARGLQASVRGAPRSARLLVGSRLDPGVEARARRLATSSEEEPRRKWFGEEQWSSVRAWGGRVASAAREMDLWETAKREGKLAWQELTRGSKRDVLTQSLAVPEEERPAESSEEVRQTALLVVEEEDTWAELRKRLREAPIIQEILRGAKKLRQTPVGQAADAVGARVRDRVEDAREFWETSQNPLVYRASSIVDAVTAENEFASAVRELRRLDPAFSVEEWRASVSKELVPTVVAAFIAGDTSALRPWLGDGLFSRLAQEIRLRKQEGLRYDDARVVDCESCDILAVQLDDHGRNPVLVVQCMTQQINCVRNREGDVVEGAPDDIRAFFYVFAFRRDYDPKTHTLAWKIIDLQLGGGETYY
mmetsp:Transcript_6545/g.19897  ORF Transcript_6545/g.19897 Transcript_6545/m.19897 type:complete len:367 (+) Transcript_6545:75-1175(+)